jgi:quinol monooxygenase YgiN
MSQINAIVLRIREEQADAFEGGFQAEEVPIWNRLAADGELVYASLTRVAFGPDPSPGVRHYLVVAEFRSMDGHEKHDADPAFEAWNAKADQFQPEEPLVFGGYSVARYPQATE